MKIPDCNFCSVHPMEVDTDNCLDFRPDPNIQEEEQWSPFGYSWYGDNLVSNKLSRYTQEEQLEILDNHQISYLINFR